MDLEGKGAEETYRVLLVEDTLDHAELISSFLRMHDSSIVIEFAESAKEGLEKAGSEHYDLLLSDYRLGPIDCFDMLRSLEEKGISLPVIILTGQATSRLRPKPSGAAPTTTSSRRTSSTSRCGW